MCGQRRRDPSGTDLDDPHKRRDVGGVVQGTCLRPGMESRDGRAHIGDYDAFSQDR